MGNLTQEMRHRSQSRKNAPEAEQDMGRHGDITRRKHVRHTGDVRVCVGRCRCVRVGPGTLHVSMSPVMHMFVGWLHVSRSGLGALFPLWLQ